MSKVTSTQHRLCDLAATTYSNTEFDWDQYFPGGYFGQLHASASVGPILGPLPEGDEVIISHKGFLALRTRGFTMWDIDTGDHQDVVHFKRLATSGLWLPNHGTRTRCRLYQTEHGLRLLASTFIEPHSPDYLLLAWEFGADREYASACCTANEYHARLTVKPCCPHGCNCEKRSDVYLICDDGKPIDNPSIELHDRAVDCPTTLGQLCTANA